MLKGFLQGNDVKKGNDIECIYFDAFYNDYIDDPFIAITSVIYEFIEGTEYDKQSTEGLTEVKKLKDKLKSIGNELVKLLPSAIGRTVQFFSGGVVKEEDIKKLYKALTRREQDELAKKITSYNKNKGSIDAFKKVLEEIAGVIKKETNSPLVIIIDELDRCKPTYAVALIERIKHFFSVKNIVFLLVMNKEQLEESIKSVYGDIDASSYIGKFIDAECTFPPEEQDIKNSIYSKYSKRLFKHFSEGNNSIKIIWGRINKDKDNEGIYLTRYLSKHFSLSLRDMNKLFLYVSFSKYIVLTSLYKKELDLIYFSFALVVLKLKKQDIKFKEQDIYSKVKARELGFNDCLREFGFDDWLESQTGKDFEDKIIDIKRLIAKKVEAYSSIKEELKRQQQTERERERERELERQQQQQTGQQLERELKLELERRRRRRIELEREIGLELEREGELGQVLEREGGIERRRRLEQVLERELGGELGQVLERELERKLGQVLRLEQVLKSMLLLKRVLEIERKIEIKLKLRRMLKKVQVLKQGLEQGLKQGLKESREEMKRIETHKILKDIKSLASLVIEEIEKVKEEFETIETTILPAIKSSIKSRDTEKLMSNIILLDRMWVEELIGLPEKGILDTIKAMHFFLSSDKAYKDVWEDKCTYGQDDFEFSDKTHNLKKKPLDYKSRGEALDDIIASLDQFTAL